ncbi:MAG: HEAT repeat domain-containing protein [Pirellulales bacterium]
MVAARLSRLLIRYSFVALAILALGTGSPRISPAQTVPDGFRAELIYEVPDIEHPSVVTCDDRGNLFVGEDPMDMRGPSTEEFDRVLYIVFDDEGRPIRKTVFCDHLAAVFGLVWHDDTLYVMHAPHYTMFRDTDGDGVADVRKRLATGFGPPAGIFGFNDHIVTGTRLGMDGLVYVSVGDKGIQKATGSDGSTITLEGGGVVRMRPDGSQLEIVSSGTRNHLDVAMDDLDNIFTYDNTDDGLGWWTRFTHHVPSGYYGYPYDYHPHPDRHLPRISEHGGGSPVGAACYREAAWPEEYRGNAFHCEWGKGKIQRFKLTRNGATFDAEIADFMTAEPGSEFRPQDLCFSPDGKAMYVADWNFAGWMQPQAAGRLYRVTYIGDEKPEPDVRRLTTDMVVHWTDSLNQPYHSERMLGQWELAKIGQPAIEPVREVLFGRRSKLARVHAIWTQNAMIDRVDGYDPQSDWVRALAEDDDADVRAGRSCHRSASHERCGRRVATALDDADPGVRMRAAIALGRIGLPDSTQPLVDHLGEPDTFARFTIVQAIRRIGYWRPLGAAIRSNDSATRETALLALAAQYDAGAVDILAEAATHDADPTVRARAVGLLAEVARQADPYVEGWWGTQPARKPYARPPVNDWSETPRILTVLRSRLDDDAPETRLATITALRTLDDDTSAERVRQLAAGDDDKRVRVAAIELLGTTGDAAALPFLAEAALHAGREVQQAAVTSLATIGTAEARATLGQLAAQPDNPTAALVLATEALGRLGDAHQLDVVAANMRHTAPEVRAAATTAYLAIAGEDGADEVAGQLGDESLDVRRAALAALATLAHHDQAPAIMAVVESANVPADGTESSDSLRFDVLRSLAAVPDRRALAFYLAGLTEKNQDLRTACRNALRSLSDEVGPDVIELERRNELSAAVRSELQTVFAAPRPVQNWHIAGPWPKPDPPQLDVTAAPDRSAAVTVGDQSRTWRAIEADAQSGFVDVDEQLDDASAAWAVLYASFESDVAGHGEALFGSDDQITVWINGHEVYQFDGDRAWSEDQNHAEFDIVKGANHVYVLSGNTGGDWAMNLKLSRPQAKYAFLYEGVAARLEPAAFQAHATSHAGDPAHGAKLFSDPQGVGCVKCHAVHQKGGSVGPDLAGIGSKYPRAELVRSVLEPSSRILSGYELSTVITDDGKVYQGVVRSATGDEIEIVDAGGKVTTLDADSVEENVRSTLSIMPNGLSDGLSLDDFVDIIAYLESLRDPAADNGAAAPTTP